jgi:hypothetical protein
MPWVTRPPQAHGLKGRENLYRKMNGFQKKFSRAFQAAVFDRFSPQGIGLRPRPWAGICRPVGPG